MPSYGSSSARKSVARRTWVKDWQHFPAERRDFRVVVEANSHQIPILLRVSVGLRQSFGSPGFVLLGDLYVDGGRLDAGVAELLLDDFQVGAAGPIQVRRIAMATRVRGVPGIQADSGHEALDHPPDPVAGEGPPLAREDRGVV